MPRAQKPLALLLPLVLGTLLAAGCERPKELRVPLDYRPTDHLEVSGLELPTGMRVAVTAVDTRTDTSAIGRNAEHDVPIPILPDQRTPDEFLRDAVSRELANAGLTIEPEPRQASKVLNVSLQRFFVEETGTYEGTIAGAAQLKDASGRRLWEGQVSGTGKRWGRSLSPENYQETLSDATVALVQGLLRNPAFVQALRAEPSRAPAGRRATH